MASLIIADYTFYTTASNNVIVQGPGIFSGIDLGNLATLNPNSILAVADTPGISSSAKLFLITIAPRAYEIRDTLIKQQQAQPSSISAAETAAQDQQSRAAGSSATNPPPGPLIEDDGVVKPVTTTASSNALRDQRLQDAGLNAPLRNNTQSIPPTTAEPGPVPPSSGEFAYPNETPGVQTPREDAAPTGGNDVRAFLNSIFGTTKTINAQSNPLDKYSSYTYNISIYLMGPRDFKTLMVNKQKNIAGWQLLLQSGGAPLASGTNLPTGANQYADEADTYAKAQLETLGRNQFFPLDYYIDDIQVKSLLAGRGSRSSHNVYELRFKIIEPNGISFLPNLRKAVEQYVGLTEPNSKPRNYAAQNYLMVIRFYGYDQNGNLVRPTAPVVPGGNSDPNAVIEKWIPFMFTGIKFKVANKLTEYECQAICPQNGVATGQQRGVIPYNIEITSTTLKDLLTGNASFQSVNQTGQTQGRQPTSAAAQTSAVPSAFNTAVDRGINNTQTAPFAVSEGLQRTLNQGNAPTVAGTAVTQTQAPPKANAAPRTLTRGLVDALNKFQDELVAAGTYAVADRYEILIPDTVLQNASIVPPGQSDLRVKPMGPGPSAPANQQVNPATQSTTNTAQNQSILAGMSIVQFIDMVTRRSTYITKQQLYTIDPVTKDLKYTGTPADTVAWYHINTQVEPIEYDWKRNDYAYKITYQLTAYAVSDPKSQWFPTSKNRGVHKRYNYWFTGLNTQILDYQIDYNYMYYMVINGPVNYRPVYTDYREYDKFSFQTRSNESDQGNSGKTFEPGANLADALYSPTDTVRCKMSIIGDPDWITQGTLWSGIDSVPVYNPFLSDNTINFDSGEALFEILTNLPVDYDLGTGLIDPGQKNWGANRNDGTAGDARNSAVYRAITCTSIFNRGKFTQELEGNQVFFRTNEDYSLGATRQTAPVVTGTSTETRSVWLTGPDESSAESKRLAAAAASARFSGQSWSQRQQDAELTLREARASRAITSESQVRTQPQAPASAPTSSGQIIGTAIPPSNTNYPSGGVAQSPVSTSVTLKSGGQQTVSTEQEITDLYNQGLIDSRNAGAAIYSLRSQIAAQQKPVFNQNSQLLRTDDN